jgi:serine protease Do
MLRQVQYAIAALLVCFAVQAQAAARGAPDSFADLVENVMPAVVNISNAQGIPGAPVLGTSSDNVSLGSGFIVDPRGIVVTNNHVIENAERITVTLDDGTEHTATLRGVDRETDLAVLMIDAERRFPYVEFGNSDKARVGDWVVAIGQPFGLGGSVSAGIVSATSRDIRAGLYDDFIQTDAAINRGNSGGPLFNTDGRVIGVNTIIFSQTGGSVGVGFAVPGNLASRVVSQLIEFGETQRGYLGVLLDDVTSDERTRLGLRNERGALVIGVPTAGGPAALAGVRRDDVIIRYGGRAIEDSRELTRAVADTPVGATVPVIVIRQGEEVSLRITVGRRETMAAVSSGSIETAGLTLQTATGETKALFGLPDDTEGVIVGHVDPRSPLASSLRPGDVILEIGWDQVRDPESFETHLSRLRDADSGPVQILVRRGERLFYARLKP